MARIVYGVAPVEAEPDGSCVLQRTNAKETISSRCIVIVNYELLTTIELLELLINTIEVEEKHSPGLAPGRRRGGRGRLLHYIV